MSAFYVGQRIKKVRGNANNGATGIILAIEDGDAHVLWDQPLSLAWYKGQESGPLPAGSPAWVFLKYCEPLLPPDTFTILAMTGADFTIRAPVAA